MQSKFTISSPAEALAYGAIIAKSGAFGVSSDEAGATIALMCMMEGISLLQFQRTYHMVDNKPSMRADTMLAKFMELGGGYEILERSAMRAAIKIWRGDGKPVEFALTIKQAQEAGYCYKKDGKTLVHNWEKIPKNMLWARVVSDAVRAMDPRVNAGIYTPEEADSREEDTGKASIEATPTPKAMPTAAPKAITTAPADPFSKLETASEPTGTAFTPPTPKGSEYEVCPAGPNKGRRFGDLPRETLEKMRDNPGPLTPQHLHYINEALDNIPF